MKKIFAFAIAACTVLALASCQTNEQPETPEAPVPAGYHMATLTVGNPATKATVNTTTGAASWEADDFVYVATSGEVIRFTASDDTTGDTKEFHAPVSDLSTYTAAVYNRYGNVSAYDGTNITASIPPSQNGSTGNFIAVAKSDDILAGDAVTLNQVTCGFLMTIPSAIASGLSSITLTVLDSSDDPVAIAGNVSINPATKAVSGADVKAVTVSKSFSAGEQVFIAAAPFSGAKLRLAFTGNDGDPYNYVRTVGFGNLGQINGSAGCINNLGTVSFDNFTNTIIKVDTSEDAGQTEKGKQSSAANETTTTVNVAIAETVSCVLNEATKQEAVINVSSISEGAVLVVDSDAAYQAKDEPTVEINLPANTPEGAFEGLVINAPNAHVTVTVGGNTVDPNTYFKSVISTTADSTLEVAAGITIDFLTVERGSVLVKYGATVNNITLGANAGAVSVEYYSNIDGLKTNNVDTYAGVVVNNWIDLYQSDSDYITSKEELIAAIAEADTEKEYKVGADFTIDSEVEIPQSFTLDLNGFVLTNAAENCRFLTLTNGATLTINNSVSGGGMVIAEDNTNSYGFVKLSNDSADNKLIINGGTYSGALLNGAFFKCLASGQEVELNNVKCVVENGTGAGSGSNIHGIGVVFDANSWSALTVNGGEFYCNTTRNVSNVAKYVFQTELTVVDFDDVKIETVKYGGFAACYGSVDNTTVAYPDGQALNWANAAIIMAHGGYSGYFGQSVISGGKYEGRYGINILTSGAEALIEGGEFYGEDAALHIHDNGGYPNAPFDITISGGEFSGVGSTPVAIQTLANANTDLKISGGKFYGALDIASASQVSITGGLFSEDPSAYVAAGCAVVDSGDATYPYEVQSFVCKIESTYYQTLEGAFEAVPADGTETTIQMLSDYELPVGNAGITVPASKNVVLDLNGCTISNQVNANTHSQVIKNNGYLTITDSSAEGNGVIKNSVKEGTQAGEWWSTPQYNYVTNVITNLGTVVMQGGTLSQTAMGSICYCIDSQSTSYDTTIILEGGQLLSEKTAMRMFCNSTVKNNRLEVPAESTVEVIALGSTAFWVQLPGSDASKMVRAELDIAGGTFKGTKYAFYDYSYGNGYDNVSYSVTGGKFYGSIVSYKPVEEAGKNYGFIKGGKFSVDPANMADVDENPVVYYNHVAEGHKSVENTDPSTSAEYPWAVVQQTGEIGGQNVTGGQGNPIW